MLGVGREGWWVILKNGFFLNCEKKNDFFKNCDLGFEIESGVPLLRLYRESMETNLTHGYQASLLVFAIIPNDECTMSVPRE